jgi:hypothetical protein
MMVCSRNSERKDVSIIKVIYTQGLEPAVSQL